MTPDLTDLREWLRSQHLSQREFCRRHTISQPYLSQILSGTRLAGKKTCELLEKLSGGVVRKRDLRPDIWA